ncbi:TRAP transporter small permease [Fulvimarina endophytica]|uniref:TRAP transporter small permease protein n=1 Tax=Fulvimarina endophytica TaxID=2293836 RepID=A0A371X9P8_9HYPH|nr:TRAP transporter small permease subunit [Fulvimarina endophytica]RFC65958.1 TRAP transporter small permease [Fulvimarina endophytica]
MPHVLGAFVQGVTTVNRLLFKACSLLLLVIVPVMLYAVVARYGFNTPSDWGLELATLLFGPYFLLGGPYLLHIGGHVNLDLVRQAASPRLNRIFDLINYPVIAAFAAVLLYYAWPFAVQSYDLGETSYTSWNPIIWPVKFVIPAALVLLFLQAVAEWFRLLFNDLAPPAGAGVEEGL